MGCILSFGWVTDFLIFGGKDGLNERGRLLHYGLAANWISRQSDRSPIQAVLLGKRQVTEGLAFLAFVPTMGNMILSLLLALQAATDPLPKPLTERHKSDIGCVATLGLLADEQRRGVTTSLRFPNVMQRGRVYAGIVGPRVMTEAQLPREVVALAIRQAVSDQQNAGISSQISNQQRKQIFVARVSDCLSRLDAEVPATAPSADDYLFCAAAISISTNQLERREGEASINASALRALEQQLGEKYRVAKFGGRTGNAEKDKADDLMAAKQVEREAAKQRASISEAEEGKLSVKDQEKYQGCITLGE